jgi:hypothetical protein
MYTLFSGDHIDCIPQRNGPIVVLDDRCRKGGDAK